MLLLLISLLVAVGIHRYMKARRARSDFRELVKDAGIQGRWREIMLQAHRTLPAHESQKLERAMQAEVERRKEESRQDLIGDKLMVTDD